MNIDVDYVNIITEERQSFIKNIKDVLKDPSKHKRQEAQSCVVCYYIHVVDGQGFTDYKCLMCGNESVYHGTRTPKICKDCAQEYRLCRFCGADEYLIPRTKL